MAGSKLKKLSPEQQALARNERNKAQAEEESVVWEEIKTIAGKTVEKFNAKRGRPTIMTEAVQSEILDRLTAGQSLSAICALEHMPSPSVLYYFMERNPSFSEKYSRACGGLATLLFNQCLDIADDDSRDVIRNPETGEVTINNAAVTRDKLRIETRFRMAGKMSGKYADKPLIGDNATVTVNTLSVNARDMDPDSRDKLRTLLLQARDSMTQA
jgi:hypothetical protein